MATIMNPDVPLPDLNGQYCTSSNAAEVLGVTGAFLGIALIAVILRTYVRISMLKILGPDDYVMIVAAVMAIGVFVCFVGETHWGVGRHNVCILPIEMATQGKWEFIHGLLIVTGVVLVKISIALFLLRLASRKSWRTFLWSAIGMNYSLTVCVALADASQRSLHAFASAAWEL